MDKKSYFNQVDLKVSFPDLEKRLLASWYKTGLIKKYLIRNKSAKRVFSFLDGPITANNPMGVHHAWGRTYKDIFQRYKNMRGFKQRFHNGFDCQGLWVEVEVEKQLKLKSKKDIENLVPGKEKASIARFVELCKARAKKYAQIQTEQSKRLGYFMDWDHSYYTLSDENNYLIWHFLRVAFENGFIYKGRDSVPWCPRCGTAISQHEILTESYQEKEHTSVYLRYPLEGAKKTYLLVWTTTPWTLPGNVVIAVDAKLDYVEAQDKLQNRYYLLAEAAKKLNLAVVKTVKGEKLVGLKYTSPFDNLPRVSKALSGFSHHVVNTESLILPISVSDGTGLVHTAPGAGTEDFQLGKILNLPVIELIDESANYLGDLGQFSGQNAKDHPEIILNYLQGMSDYLYKIEKVLHRYPACWRCNTELVWRVVDEWYIAMDRPTLKATDDKAVDKRTLRERMIEVAKSIKWIPDFGLERELDWLNNMHDWLISKKRYWGLALPIWECQKCGNFEVIGGYEQLKQKATSGWDKFASHSPHKPSIDEVKIKCSVCQAIMERIPDVGNPWLDAGIVSFSAITKDNMGQPLYEGSRKEWEKWFPADFITESFPGQFKNWFYSLIAMSTVLENREPFKTVLGFATLFGEDGRPMHKSWGNSVEFNEGADKIGVDVMRWMFLRQNPTENLLFGYKLADEVRRKFHLKLWNVYNFFVTYANLDGWKPGKKTTSQGLRTSVLDKWILMRLNQVNQQVTASLDNYDTYNAVASLEKFVDDLSNWYIRRCRDRVGPWAELKNDKFQFFQTTYFVLVTLAKMLAPFIPFIAEEIFKNLSRGKSVHLIDWPLPSSKLKAQSSKLIEEMARARELVEKIHAARKEAKIPTRQPLNSYSTTDHEPVSGLVEQLIKEETNIKQIFWDKKQNKLDTKITPNLEEEAKTRDLIRRIQEERKKLGLMLHQGCVIYSEWLPDDVDNIGRIKRKTLAVSLRLAKKFKVAPTNG